jgi:ComF family protein
MLKNLFNLVMPPKCLACNNIVEEQGIICANCYPDLSVIGTHKCHRCGLPFEFDHGPKAICATCTTDKPKFDMARAFCAYEGLGGDLATKLKFGDKTSLAPYMARLMCVAGSGLIKKADVITAVPLYRTRKLKRKYNQAALLAQYIAKYSGIKYEPFLLKRIKNTKQQTKLSKLQRQQNVAGAFEAKTLQGKRVLVIDDVMTTGATMSACARALKKQGTKKVYGLVFARVE